MDIPNLSPWQPHSTLFTIRLWQEASGKEQSEVRMEVRHVLSGETRHFRTWGQLAEYLEQKLHEPNSVQEVKGENKKYSITP